MTLVKTLITEISFDARRHILFQAAVHWAEEGCKVLYITQSQFDYIPTTSHGQKIPSTEVLTKIRIVYPENLEELIKFVADILTFCDTVPRVMLVEGLSDYTQEDDHGLARVCSILCHVATGCAAQSDQPTHLVVTMSSPTNKLPPVLFTMFDTVWCFSEENNSLTRKIPSNCSKVVLSIGARNDGSYVLRTISQLFAKPNS